MNTLATPPLRLEGGRGALMLQIILICRGSTNAPALSPSSGTSCHLPPGGGGVPPLSQEGELSISTFY